MDEADLTVRRVITYIDGFNLYFGLKAKGWRRYLWVNPQLLGSNLLKPDQQLVGTKYFTARIAADSGDPAKHRRQGTFLEAIETLPATTIHYGHYLRKPQRCFSCGAQWLSHEEKMTDVQIAVELLADAVDDRFDAALLISADSDLAPPITAVRTRFPNKTIVVACPPERRSQKLQSVANGYVLTRPTKWT